MKSEQSALDPSVIVVTETVSHYLVRIPTSLGAKIRQFGGGQWDGKRKIWAFRKSMHIFEKLRSELEASAAVFAIHPPSTRNPDQPEELPDADEQAREELSVDLGPIEAVNKLKELPTGIHEALNQIREGIVEHHRAIQEIAEDLQQLAEQVVIVRAPVAEASIEPRVVEKLPELLDLNKSPHLQLLEKAMIGIAYFTSNQDRGFMTWVVSQKPLQTPAEFVQNTHELLKVQLEKITGNEDPHTPFWKLVQDAKDKNLIYHEKEDPVKPIPILSNLNAIRNQFAHSRQPLGHSGRHARAILYLMNLSLIWSLIIIDDESVEEAVRSGKHKPLEV